ncbi:hypothetical protein FOA43_003866 [Brettanomyces nanus]|uniref:Uncharacterized protein n=1 Tax=Eeniella nana TaxID=13502 RepID=A0A875RWS3_EENNA|nr:uncharacterized protein FOA43_003866 [Brettanomyces nanus]QPG76477.1 hypothetical protein FOA43_003866 [Brettanomyces nanus]
MSFRSDHTASWNTTLRNRLERQRGLKYDTMNGLGNASNRSNGFSGLKDININKKGPAKPKRVSGSYSQYFYKVFQNRMKYYHRLSFVISLSMCVLLTVPYGGSILFYPVKVALLSTGFALVKFARDSTLRVESSGASTEIQHMINSVFSSQCFILFAAYFASTFIIYSIIFWQSSSSDLSYCISSATKTVKPFINDSFMFFWFFVAFTSFFYSAQMMIFEKNKLNFKIGTYRAEPVDQLKNLNWVSLLKEAASISGCVVVLSGPLYTFVRRFIFKVMFYPMISVFNLNRQIPAIRFSLRLYLTVNLIGFITVLVYELLNRIYNAYAMTGCLVVKKPLSSYSDNQQFKTLMSGLTDYKDSLVRLTAYQELVFRTTSRQMSDRTCLYENNNGILLLDQMSKVIRSSVNAAKMELPKLQGTKGEKKPTVKKQNGDTTATIFGRLGLDAGLNDTDSVNAIGADDGDVNGIFSTNKVRPEDLFLRSTYVKKPLKSKDPVLKGFVEKAEDAALKLIQKYQVLFVRKMKEFINSRSEKSRILRITTKVLKSDVWEVILFRSYKLEADRRIPNKVIVGNCIVAMSEMLLHARIEDRKRTVLHSLTEVLSLLTRIYRSTSEFLENPPVKPRSANQINHNAIKEINDLAISYFFKLVIYYNSTLNDMILTPDTFKLAKWCTDVALEEQRAQLREVE